MLPQKIIDFLFRNDRMGLVTGEVNLEYCLNKRYNKKDNTPSIFFLFFFLFLI